MNICAFGIHGEYSRPRPEPRPDVVLIKNNHLIRYNNVNVGVLYKLDNRVVELYTGFGFGFPIFFIGDFIGREKSETITIQFKKDHFVYFRHFIG